ncbi:MAG TPA: LLM class flavin-dependent oxidoreductase [Actinomycetota bacterium]|jgi:alkanesulfonate monooxygenase SsuD/methylene tetrahydromethanopterin reductase-like flavin-dependent oxidoreductase (luciferase family)
MKIGVGLPNPIPGTTGETLVEWARKADELGFSSLATIDRIVYPSYESLVALGAAAAVTTRIGLLTNVLLAPTRATALLAKGTASVDRLSGGRLTLGLGVGGREDDFTAVDKPMRGRGKRFDRQLEEMHELWAGKTLSDTKQASVPSPGRPVPILIGGGSDVTPLRVARWGIGYTAGGGPPDSLPPMVERVGKAWADAGREGTPKIVALTYYALGPDAEAGAHGYITDYYAMFGDFAKQMASLVPKSPDAIRAVARQFEDAGADELILDPTIASLDQLDRLADAVL